MRPEQDRTGWPSFGGPAREELFPAVYILFFPGHGIVDYPNERFSFPAGMVTRLRMGFRKVATTRKASDWQGDSD